MKIDRASQTVGKMAIKGVYVYCVFLSFENSIFESYTIEKTTGKSPSLIQWKNQRKWGCSKMIPQPNSFHKVIIIQFVHV